MNVNGSVNEEKVWIRFSKGRPNFEVQVDRLIVPLFADFIFG